MTARGRRSDRRGAVLPIVAASVVVLLGIAALAIDLGIMYTARSEAQRAADAGAHAGAGLLSLAPNDEAGAREQARLYAQQNPIRGVAPVVLDEDIDVILAEQKVRVRVQRSTARGNPVSTLFARVLGIGDVDIGAEAAAQAWPADGVNCPLPLIMPDRWSKGPSLSNWPGPGETFDPAAGHVYVPWNPDAGGSPGVDYTGYGMPDRGTRIMITMAKPSESPQPGWYYSIRLPEMSGGADYRSAVAGCWDVDAAYTVGMEVVKEPGNMIGPTLQGFQDLVAQDPGAIWNQSANAGYGCVTDADSNVCRSSPRIRPMLMFDPQEWPYIDNGAKPVQVKNFVGVFVESVVGAGDVYVRFVNYTGIQPASEWSSTSALPRIIRIVE